MRIVDAHWRAEGPTMLELACHCGKVFRHRSDRWTIHCPTCHSSSPIQDLRSAYEHTHNQGPKRAFLPHGQRCSCCHQLEAECHCSIAFCLNCSQCFAPRCPEHCLCRLSLEG